MKKWLLAAGLGLALATSAQAADKIAIVNMGSLFQQVAQKTVLSQARGVEKFIVFHIPSNSAIMMKRDCVPA